MDVASELSRFCKILHRLSQSYQLEEKAPYAFLLKPPNAAATSHKLLGAKPIPLTFLALIHGNESVGLSILNEILALLAHGVETLSFPLAFALGNVEAALQGKRFLEKDLNRCFASTGPARYQEQKRALELMDLLKDSYYLIDFHQTSLPNAEPFFIFPYRRESLDLARSLAPFQAIVTHWGEGFSREGLCSDEFVNSQGGRGLTIETGQAGFDPYQIGYGVFIARQALACVKQALDRGLALGAEAQAHELRAPEGKLYSWASTCPLEAEESVHLKAGLYNFKDVRRGDEMGSRQGKPFYAEATGKLLFPKYVPAGTPREQYPTELYRIVAPINPNQLPKAY